MSSDHDHECLYMQGQGGVGCYCVRPMTDAERALVEACVAEAALVRLWGFDADPEERERLADARVDATAAVLRERGES